MKLLPLVTLAFATFALGLGELMIAGILPVIAHDVGVSIPLAGQLVSVYALTFAALSPPLTIIMQRIDAKRVLCTSLLVVALANAVAATGASFAVLIAARILAAGGSAVATPLALAAIDRVTDEARRGRAHGIVFTGFSLAAMLGVPLGAIIARNIGWRPTFTCVAILASCAAIGIARTIPSGARAQPLKWSALRATIGRRALQRTLVVSTLFLTAQYTLFTYFRPYFAHVTGAGTTQIVWLFFVYGAFGIAGTLPIGWGMDRWGTRRALLFAIGGCVVTLVALAFVRHTGVASLIAVAAWAVTAWGFGPVVNRQLERDAGDVGGVAIALNLTAFNAGISLGSALGGATIAIAGIADLPLISASLCAIAFVLVWRPAPAARRLPG